jgi:hypothetical protein
MSETIEPVLIDGCPALKITDIRSDVEKSKTHEFVEYHVMTPADAERLGQAIIKLAKG